MDIIFTFKFNIINMSHQKSSLARQTLTGLDSMVNWKYIGEKATPEKWQKCS
jgi:hypothetical protein